MHVDEYRAAFGDTVVEAPTTRDPQPHLPSSRFTLGQRVQVRSGDEAGRRLHVVGFRRRGTQLMIQLGQVIDIGDQYSVEPFAWYVAEGNLEPC